ncbi:MAG: cyclodeaminase/cyclohydrolase family protein [Phycisphaerales bacterium]|jgi:formiminotetrahydrofolate cyclodeaminase|nr:cyclodeaminase/cyclohydrolase family protein [Phycisphaerales bacterium]
MLNQDVTIREFLDAAAAKKPTPGGGSVAALVGALAASMGEMVLNYSVGKKDLAVYAGELKSALESFHRARRILTQLMEEDQAAFEVISTIKKLPIDNAERIDRLPAALLACIRAPQTMAATGVAILELCDRMVDRVNYYLLSDLAVSADLAMATVRCAVYNVRVNLGDITEVDERRSIESTCGQMLSHALTLIQRVSPRIQARCDKGP